MSAANQGGFRCKIANTSENAMDYYLKKQPQVSSTLAIFYFALCKTLSSDSTTKINFEIDQVTF